MSDTTTILEDIKRRGARQRGRTPRDAVDFIYLSNDEMFDTPFAEVEQIQLRTLKARFETLREKIAPLRQLANLQKIRGIERIEDAAPLLFGPKVLKSYPLSLLEQNQFDKLTQWLNRLTTHDLLSVDVTGCDTIDGWLDRLEAQTPMRVMHSSGTSGKLSILPFSRTELHHRVEIWFKYMCGYGGEYGADLRTLNGDIPIFLPTYRYGRHIQRAIRIIMPAVCGTEDQLICAYPGTLSADLLSLGGRLAAAESKGDLGNLKLNPALLAQRAQIVAFQRQQPQYMEAFFQKMLQYRGRRVLVAGTWPVHFRAAMAAQAHGIEGLFAPDSFPVASGGKKGENFPEDWYQRICRVYGIPDIRSSYGMVELMGLMQECRQRHFHPWPHQIVYLLDTASGRLLPRIGIQRGRFAFMDLSAETYWGGGVSGDLVTIHWGDSPCGCGRQGPYIEPTISRLSEQQGGDDKISCAGAQSAHDAALEFLSHL